VTPDTNDYTQLTNEQLSELIRRLSVESRNRYETRMELEKLRQEHRAGLDNDPEVLRTAFNHPIKLGGKVLAGVDNIDAIMTEADKLCSRWEERINNIDAKAPRNDSEAIPDAE
jgi:phage baseplate assembly protein W